MAKYLELVRVRSVKKPRKDWQLRWGAAVDAAKRKGLLTIPKQEERMIAKEGSPIWKKLAEGAGGFRDATGEGEPPFAFGSVMGWKEVNGKELRVKSDNISETTKNAENTKTLREVSLQSKQIKEIVNSAIEKFIPKKPLEMTIKFGLFLAIPLSIFGEPFPPFDWGSGMGVMDVSKREAIELGLITEEELQAKREELRVAEQNKTLPSMNGNLQATVPATQDVVSRMKADFGDLADVVRVDEGVQLKWRPEILKETVLQKKDFRVECGCASDNVLDTLRSRPNTSSFADAIEGKQLVVDQTWRDTPRSQGGTHIKHFYPIKKHTKDTPLKPEDLEMLPSMWRKPTRTRKNKQDEFDLELDTIDGSTFIMRVKIVVDETTGETYPKLWTFFRTTDPASKKNGLPKQKPKP